MPLSAIVLIVVASACFSTVDVTVRHLGQRYPVPTLVWARWSLQALVLVALAGPTMRLGPVRTSHLPLHLVRGAVLIVSSLCFFSALRFLPLAEATALNYTSPILVTLMASWLLRDRLTRPRWAFIAAGFLGMLLIIRPGTQMLTPTALFALGAAWFYAIFQILTRKLAGENLMVLLVYPCLVGAVGLSLAAPFAPDPSVHPTSDLVAFVGIGIVGAVRAGVPARIGVGDRAVHLHATGVVDAGRLAIFRDISRRLDADRHHRDRGQRCGAHLV